jgi:hypothetical protein
LPILKPEVREALRKAGLAAGSADSSEIEKALDDSGLSLSSSLETLAFLQENAQSDNTKLQAVALALKARGFLKDQPATAPSISIVIQDPNFASDSTQGVNRVLLPRELLGKPESKPN